MLSGQPDVWLV